MRARAHCSIVVFLASGAHLGTVLPPRGRWQCLEILSVSMVGEGSPGISWEGRGAAT